MFSRISRPHSSGFTLIELSIVLVIIGLLVGGILVGRELIKTAETRQIMSEFEQLEVAHNAFKLKFNALAGDFNRAEAIWGSDASCPSTPYNTVKKTATCNGNGNGVIADISGWRMERYRYFQHLSNAGLIEGSYTGAQGSTGVDESIAGVNVMASKLNSAAFYISGLNGVAAPMTWNQNYGSIMFYGKKRPSANEGHDYGAVPPIVAYGIDVKIDDGLPASGKFFVADTLVTGYCEQQPCNCTTTSVPSTAAYVNSNPENDCTMIREIAR